MAMRDYLNKTIYGVNRSLIREYGNKAASIPGCISLTLGEPDFDTPACISAKVTEALLNHQTHYIPNQGNLSLRTKIAQFEKDHYGMDYKPAEVIVTVGATEGIFSALYTILNPGDEVIIPTPAFLLYEEAVKLCNAKPVFLDTTEDHFEIKKEKLAALITDKTKAILINTPNNPTGCILHKESLDAVHDLVKDKPIFVICDDVYRQLVYVDDYHSMMEYRDLREQLILIQSYSKPYAMTGWRMGYVIADETIIERLELIHQYLITSTPGPFQAACEEALDFDPSAFRETYRKRRDYVLGRLSEMGLPVTMPEGAFYIFPSIKELNISSAEFCNRLMDEAKLALTPGICFGSEGNVRISYCASDANLEEGMNRLEGFIKKLRGE